MQYLACTCQRVSEREVLLFVFGPCGTPVLASVFQRAQYRCGEQRARACPKRNNSTDRERPFITTLHLVKYNKLSNPQSTTISCSNCGTFSELKLKIGKVFHVENLNLDKNVSRGTYILWSNFNLTYVSCETF